MATQPNKYDPVPVRFPLIGAPTARSTATKDQRYVNVYFDTVTNPISSHKRTFVIKRPGLSNSTQPPAGAATGRGVYYWSGSGGIYSVFDNKIYNGTTDLGVT